MDICPLWWRPYPVVLEKLIFVVVVKKFAVFYATRVFITVLKEPTTCPCPLQDESSPHTHMQHNNFKIHANIVLPVSRLSGFRARMLYKVLISIIRVTCLDHLLLHLVTDFVICAVLRKKVLSQ